MAKTPKKTSPLKPPSAAQKSKAGRGLATGKLSKPDTRSQSGRIEAEGAAAKKAAAKKMKK
jgi:hypothetical protein